MIYLELTDHDADIELYLEGTYSIRDLLDLIAEHADGESDTTEESDEDSEEEEDEEIEEGHLGRFVKLGC
jgi:hypothetical protein